MTRNPAGTEFESRIDSIHETSGDAPATKDENHVFIMPGPAEEIAEEVAAEGVEGRPADVRAGPRMLWGELAIVVALVVGSAVALGIWLGWLAGLAGLGFGILALLFNPVVGATLNRAHDRDVVAQRRARRA